MASRSEDSLTARFQPLADADDAPPDRPSFDPAADTAASWLAKAARGDRGAFGRFVVLYQDRLFNTLLRLIGDFDEAGELTQEAFTRALATLHQFRADSAPYPWLFRIASTLAMTRLRQVQRRRSFSLSRDNDEPPRAARPRDQASALRGSFRSNGSTTDTQQRARAQQAMTALGRLDPDQRLLLVMRDVEGFDYEQIAELLNVPLGTLKSRLFRCRIALRDQLKHVKIS